MQGPGPTRSVRRPTTVVWVAQPDRHRRCSRPARRLHRQRHHRYRHRPPSRTPIQEQTSNTHRAQLHRWRWHPRRWWQQRQGQPGPAAHAKCSAGEARHRRGTCGSGAAGGPSGQTSSHSPQKDMYTDAVSQGTGTARQQRGIQHTPGTRHGRVMHSPTRSHRHSCTTSGVTLTSPVWDTICLARREDFRNAFPHPSHKNSLNSWGTPPSSFACSVVPATASSGAQSPSLPSSSLCVTRAPMWMKTLQKMP